MLVWFFSLSISHPGNVFTSLACCNRQAWTLKHVQPYLNKISLFSHPIKVPGPFQRLLFSCLKHTISPRSYIKDVAVLVFVIIAILSFLLDFDSVNAAWGACITFIWLAIISLDVWPSNGGGLSMSTDIMFGFLPKTSWFGVRVRVIHNSYAKHS